MTRSDKTVAVIGAGPAGMEAATQLAAKGINVILIEDSDKTGGHLNQWDRLFPARRPATEVWQHLRDRLPESVQVLENNSVDSFRTEGGQFFLQLNSDKHIRVDALILATGFEVFHASRKEEYGYGIYDNVITSVDLETIFREHKPLTTHQGKKPSRIALIHCVGSRDEKAGHVHCSRVCCVTGVKQAIEIKELLPEAQVYCFYMDLRMFGLGYEELYKESQEKWGVQFIRGRLSESFENQDGSIMLKVEDTLTARPLKMNVDLLVLLVGFLPSAGTTRLGKMFDLEFNPNGFLMPADELLATNDTRIPGVFLAGSCKGPKNIEDTLTDARSAACRVDQYLKDI